MFVHQAFKYLSTVLQGGERHQQILKTWWNEQELPTKKEAWNHTKVMWNFTM